MSVKYKSGFTRKGAKLVEGEDDAAGTDSNDKPCAYGRTLQDQDNPSVSLSDPGDMVPGKEGLR